MAQDQARQRQQKNDLKNVNKPRIVPGEFTPEIHPLLLLQKQIGNAKVSRMVADNDQLQKLPEVGLAGGPVSNQLTTRITSQLGKGSPLPTYRREQMELKFGQSLENVRLHTGDEADHLNQSISARAFTLGNDIFFGNRASPNDNNLLSHELTHVVQQQSMPLGGPLTVGPSEDQYEQQAQSTAGNAKAFRMAYQTEPVVQRDDDENEVIIRDISGQYETGASAGSAGASSRQGDNTTPDSRPSGWNPPFALSQDEKSGSLQYLLEKNGIM